MPDTPSPPTVGIVLRFSNSAATLPDVLTALGKQTRRPDFIVGVNNGSSDGSPRLLAAAGAKVIDWTGPYHHARVVNFGIRNCPTDLVMMLSSHTVLEADDAVARLVDAMADPNTACASGKWDDDPYLSDAITFPELKQKGLKFGSIYSNSMGMVRRSLWEETPFDETLPGMEDYAWALEQVSRGRVCRRLALPVNYQRQGKARHFFFAAITFKLAARYGLRTAWRGPKSSALEWLNNLGKPAADVHRERLSAWLLWRWKKNLSE